ncbi:sensor domain-containing diguanylate cyclase [Leptospira ognonensis]|uniref:diguanylate cyclase n=1 Tax=Leptospira ognonensis TaxID=2484945 RepID=A0A4R9K0B5_9LEPT|nr:sensor domain-containing diguanylate cyclase [Leptospira ognonensis]TGL59083.1 sensor domain-containing diguanylate cyclase [Leptospira ognonensis]
MTHEEDRLKVLTKYQISKLPESEFDLLTRVAAELCHTPYAFISIVDKDTVWTKSAYGTENTETSRAEDLCNFAIQDGINLTIENLRTHPISRNLPIAKENSPYQCYLGANLITSEGYRLGSLCILDDHPRILTDVHLQLLNQLAKQVMALFELKIKSEELAAAYLKMERLANYDELTGLLGRRAFLELLEKQIVRPMKAETLYFVFLDLDYFKSINDTYGHDAGDEVLRQIGEKISFSVQNKGYACRFGGEEFCLLIFDSNDDSFQEFMESLRLQIAEMNIQLATRSINVTASFGVSKMQSQDSMNIDLLIKIADQAVYEAKKLGRNQVVYHTQTNK